MKKTTSKTTPKRKGSKILKTPTKKSKALKHNEEYFTPELLKSVTEILTFLKDTVENISGRSVTIVTNSRRPDSSDKHVRSYLEIQILCESRKMWKEWKWNIIAVPKKRSGKPLPFNLPGEVGFLCNEVDYQAGIQEGVDTRREVQGWTASEADSMIYTTVLTLCQYISYEGKNGTCVTAIEKQQEYMQRLKRKLFPLPEDKEVDELYNEIFD